MSEFLPETDRGYTISENGTDRTVSAWESWLSEENYEYYEGYCLTLDDSTVVTCTQHVLYHDTVSEAYAGLVFDEKARELEQKYDLSGEALTIPGLDGCILFSGRSAALVICRGDTVMQVTFSMRYIDDESGYCRDAMLRFAENYASGLEG